MLRELVGIEVAGRPIVASPIRPGVQTMASLNAVTQWDQRYDLVIAGFGLAAMCAAIEAHDLDPSLSILILEKSGEA